VRELKIRVRDRRGYSREAGGYDVWTEYQVVEGRKIIGRFEIRDHAEEFIAKREGREPAP